jgi:FtsH-binding integral membrane protein
MLGGQYVALADDLWLFGVMAAGFSFLHLEANFAFARDDRRVLLVLLMAVAGIILGVDFYHESIRQVAICINVALVMGYAGILALNAFNRKLGD